MEGELLKWTNYWNGWQPRWFLLHGTTLYYYKSHDDVIQGDAKGSVNVTQCEITVHATESTRLDFSIVGEQHICVRANCESERQQWLVALGSAKACSTSTGTGTGTGPTKAAANDPSASAVTLQAKKAEMRLYCDMLMQQVHLMKQAVEETPNIHVDLLNDGSCLLTQTCDTFISTLEEVLELAEHSKTDKHFGERTYQQNGSGKDFRLLRASSAESSLSTARTHCGHACDSSSQRDTPEGGFHSLFGGDGKSYSCKQQVKGFVIPFQVAFPTPGGADGNKIDTRNFLAASKCVLVLFDLLNPKAFAPIKFDIQGNIQCLMTKFHSNMELYSCLDSIVSQELSDSQAHQVTSGTQALLWLVRSLMFVHNFLTRLIESTNSESAGGASGVSSGAASGATSAAASTSVATPRTRGSVEACLVAAYEETLLKHHGLVVRSVFSVAVHQAPDRPTLLYALCHRGARHPKTSEDPTARHRRPFRDPDRDPDPDIGTMQTKMAPAFAAYLEPLEKCIMAILRIFQEAGIEI